MVHISLRKKGAAMTEHTSASAAASALDARIAAFEYARQANPDAPLGQFLPPPADPDYPEAVRELVRRDLRSRWRRGDAVRLDSYRDAFPILFEHTALLADVALEEYRQMVQTGQAVTPADYRERYGLDVDAWPP